jgi:hypothetical protein
MLEQYTLVKRKNNNMDCKDTYMQLVRKGNRWRMDGKTFCKFMSHVSGYFMTKDLDQDLSLDNVLYAEITSDDLYVVSAIFGAYSPNENTIILAPVHPGCFILPWLNYFQLKVCEKNEKAEDRDNTRSILLRAV